MQREGVPCEKTVADTEQPIAPLAWPWDKFLAVQPKERSILVRSLLSDEVVHSDAATLGVAQ